MPRSNIEIHGASVGTEWISEFWPKIMAIFENWPCAREMVVTIADSAATDLQGVPQPFLRVWDTDAERGRMIARRLRLEGFEVELPVKLAGFLPKPLYSREEIEAELQLLAGEHSYQWTCVREDLLLGDSTSARNLLNRGLLYTCADDKKIPQMGRVEAPDQNDASHKAFISRHIRRFQMLAILSE